jgi:hypothetical protein
LGNGPQITEYERPYNIVYGEVGAEAQFVPGPEGHPDFPIWRARHMVMAILTTQTSKTEDADEIEQFKMIRREFRNADTGELLDGMVRKFRNRQGKVRFIGLVPKGVDYREAGKPRPRPERPKLKAVPRFDPTLERGLPVSERKPQRPKRMTEAERIADKMAKASRKAVEG